MEFNKISKAMLGMGMLAVAGSACALEAWNGQEGGDTIQVIFDGSVYQNAWWVGATNCPVTPDAPEGSNPWNYVRDATPAEITQYGNPTSCDIPGSDTPTYPAFSADKVYQEGILFLPAKPIIRPRPQYLRILSRLMSATRGKLISRRNRGMLKPFIIKAMWSL